MDLEKSEKESSPQAEVANSPAYDYSVQTIADIPSYGRMGLENSNNMCYMNSAIQVCDEQMFFLSF